MVNLLGHGPLRKFSHCWPSLSGREFYYAVAMPTTIHGNAVTFTAFTPDRGAGGNSFSHITADNKARFGHLSRKQ